jgi:hypothetical protein
MEVCEEVVELNLVSGTSVNGVVGDWKSGAEFRTTSQSV